MAWPGTTVGSRSTAARPTLRRTLVGLVLVINLAGLLAGPVAAYDYSTPKIDFLSEEAMRLINLDRMGNGLSVLARDQKLINLTRDLPYACPSNSSMILNGRARDMYERNYFSHYILNCWKNSTTQYSSMDIMNMLGYTNFRGEIIAHNTYGVSATQYKWGCDVYDNNCDGSTETPYTASADEYWWMHDSSHRAIILGAFDRFGCGRWVGSDGSKIVSCLFAMGGPNPVDTTPPTVQSATGNGASVQQGSSITLSATVADNFRLSDGWVVLDPNSNCNGTSIHGWGYNLNVASDTHAFAWNTTGVAAGTHSIGWRVRDTSTLMSSCYVIQVTVTAGGTPTAPSASFSSPALGSTVATGSGSNTVSWSEYNGGATIQSRTLTEYYAPLANTADCSGVTWVKAWSASSTSPLTITGFNPGYCYYWTLSLTNSVGTGTATSGNLLVTPAASFSSPAAGSTVATGTSTNTVTWAENTSGATLSSRTVSEYVGRAVHANDCLGVTWTKAFAASMTSPLKLTGMNSGYCYYWTVSLTNSKGLAYTATSGSLLVTPAASFTSPAAGATVSTTNTTNTITWAENAAGSPITLRTVSEYYGAVVTSGSCAGVSWAQAFSATNMTSPLTATGMNHGVCYYWTVRLTNANGLASTATSGYLLVQ